MWLPKVDCLKFTDKIFPRFWQAHSNSKGCLSFGWENWCNIRRRKRIPLYNFRRVSCRFCGKNENARPNTEHLNQSLYRYWWNTRIFPFTKKSYLHRALSEHTIFIFHVWGYWCRHGIFLFFIGILTFWNRKFKYYCRYFSLITLYPGFITFLWPAFCDRWPLQLHYFAVSKMNKKKSCVLCRNFIGIYKIIRERVRDTFSTRR